ncbi:MAG: cyclic-di-AMP receptor [Thermomicrobiales bacterium]
MKLILAIVQDYDTDRVLRGITSAGFRVTRISSTGGFLRSTNATLLVGVEDHEVRRCLAIIRENCGTRVHEMETGAEEYWLEASGLEIARDASGGAVVIVLPVSRYERLGPEK